MNLDGYDNVKVHSLNPMVVTIDDFCSPDEVQRLMDHAGQLEFKTATVVDGPLDKQTRVDSTVRNATVCHPATCAAALSPVCDRVSALLDIRLPYAKPQHLRATKQVESTNGTLTPFHGSQERGRLPPSCT